MSYLILWWNTSGENSKVYICPKQCSSFFPGINLRCLDSEYAEHSRIIFTFQKSIQVKEIFILGHVCIMKAMEVSDCFRKKISLLGFMYTAKIKIIFKNHAAEIDYETHSTSKTLTYY